MVRDLGAAISHIFSLIMLRNLKKKDTLKINHILSTGHYSIQNTRILTTREEITLQLQLWNFQEAYLLQLLSIYFPSKRHKDRNM